MQETQESGIQSLGGKDPLEKEMTTHSNILAWEIPWTDEPGGLQSTGHLLMSLLCPIKENQKNALVSQEVLKVFLPRSRESATQSLSSCLPHGKLSFCCCELYPHLVSSHACYLLRVWEFMLKRRVQNLQPGQSIEERLVVCVFR